MFCCRRVGRSHASGSPSWPRGENLVRGDWGSNSGVGRGGEQAIETPLAECEFEQVCEVADLVESWVDRPTNGVSDQPGH